MWGNGEIVRLEDHVGSDGGGESEEDEEGDGENVKLSNRGDALSSKGGKEESWGDSDDDRESMNEMMASRIVILSLSLILILILNLMRRMMWIRKGEVEDSGLGRFAEGGDELYENVRNDCEGMGISKSSPSKLFLLQLLTF